MNKIELLPKAIIYKEQLFQLGMWITAFDRLCIGYRHVFNMTENLFCVCVEPEHTPVSIIETENAWINSYIGNSRNVDDACEEILSYIEKRKNKFDIPE